MKTSKGKYNPILRTGLINSCNKAIYMISEMVDNGEIPEDKAKALSDLLQATIKHSLKLTQFVRGIGENFVKIELPTDAIKTLSGDSES